MILKFKFKTLSYWGHILSPDNPDVRPFWPEIGHRFNTEANCLAAFIALETAEVIAGVKPANLLCLKNAKRRCGRNYYLLWERLGP